VRADLHPGGRARPRLTGLRGTGPVATRPRFVRVGRAGRRAKSTSMRTPAFPVRLAPARVG
jgi:hypothetical protein